MQGSTEAGQEANCFQTLFPLAPKRVKAMEKLTDKHRAHDVDTT
jgi:hypothetical protein